MKKHLISALAVAVVLTAGLTVWAQQDNARRRGGQQRLEAQKKAIEAIQADTAKLGAALDSAAQARQNRGPREDLTEEQRTELRQQWTKRREEQLGIIADIELQIAKLKGGRQLRGEHDKAQAELKAIRDLATGEKAGNTAARLGTLIDQRQAEFEKTLATLGFDAQPGGRN